MLGLDSKDNLSRVPDFVLLSPWRLEDGGCRLSPSPALPLISQVWKWHPSPVSVPHSSPLPLQLQPPALSFSAAMREVQLMTSPHTVRVPQGKRQEWTHFFLHRGECVNFFFLFYQAPCCSSIFFFFLMMEINANRKKKTSWLHIMLAGMWHVRAMKTGNRYLAHSQSQPCLSVVSRGWSSLSQPTQLSAHSGGLDLGGEPNRVCHSKGINVRLRHVDSILPVGIT